MTDVLLSQTENDGDIEIVDGLVTLTDDFRTAAYLSLFGGNELDDGRDNNPLTWWGNLTEIEPGRQYISETEFLLQSLPSIANNLLRLEDAANRDLKSFVENGSAESVEARVSIIELNTLKYDISINGNETVTFIENWKAASEL